VRFMRMLVAVGAVAATATTLAVAPAVADPVNTHYKSVTPLPWDIIGVGSATTQYLVDQLSYNYDAGLAARHVKDTSKNPYIYSWDAVPPNKPTDTTQNIKVKPGCSSELRPGSSGAGITALGTFGTTTYKGHKYSCVSFARSSRARKSTDPVFGAKGVAFAILAQDAVTFATPSNSYLPATTTLTAAELKGIFDCSITTFGQLGVKGANASKAIDPIIPELSSGTLSFWYTALGLGTAAGEPTCSSLAGLTKGLPEENEGVSQYFHAGNNVKNAYNPAVITLYSIGAWVDQAVHSKVCGKSPRKGQNFFGCDANGKLVVRGIAGKAPIVTAHKKTTINGAFPALFKRFLYDVVPYATNTSNHIPSNLQRFFDSSKSKVAGFFCSKKQVATIEDYGFLPSSACGFTD
jgi:ABC-type phosphate transport system substrate-binding protein